MDAHVQEAQTTRRLVVVLPPDSAQAAKFGMHAESPCLEHCPNNRHRDSAKNFKRYHYLPIDQLLAFFVSWATPATLPP